MAGSKQVSWYADQGQWEALRSVGVVEACAKSTANPVWNDVTISAVCPQTLTVYQGRVCGHSSIENQLHWVLDVSFAEDQSRQRKDHSAQNFSRLRRIALNLLRRETTKKRGIKGKRLNAAWDHDYLLKLLGG